MPTTIMTGQPPVAMTRTTGRCVDCLDDQADVLAFQVDLAMDMDVDDATFDAFIASIDDEFDTGDDLVLAAETWRMSPTGQVRHVCGLHAAMHDEAAELDDDPELLAIATTIGLIEGAAS